MGGLKAQNWTIESDVKVDDPKGNRINVHFDSWPFLSEGSKNRIWCKLPVQDIPILTRAFFLTLSSLSPLWTVRFRPFFLILPDSKVGYGHELYRLLTHPVRPVATVRGFQNCTKMPNFYTFLIISARENLLSLMILAWFLSTNDHSNEWSFVKALKLYHKKLL